MKAIQPIWKELYWERPYELTSVVDLLVQLAGLATRKKIVWEIRSKQGNIRYLIGYYEDDESVLKQLFKVHGKISLSKASTVKRAPVSLAKELKITKPTLSLKTDHAESVSRATLAHMANTSSKEELVIQLVIGRSYAPKTLSKSNPNPDASLFQVLLGTIPPISSSTKKLLKEKIEQHSFHATVRLAVSSLSTKRAHEHIRGLLSSLRILESAGARLSLRESSPEKVDGALLSWRKNRLSVSELANFLLLPIGQEDYTGLPSLHPKLLSAPSWYKNPSLKERRAFALESSVNEAEERKLLSISPNDSSHHTFITGATGVGKSTVALNLLLESARLGQAILLIDPKLDLANDFMARLPESRKDDVIVISPESATPIGFNPLQSFGQSPELVADAILAVFKDMFSDNFGIRSSDVLTATLMTLAKTKNSTLVMLPILLTDKTFRQNLLKDITDPNLLSFWNWYEQLSVGERSQLISPTLNKMRQLLLRENMRNVLSQSNPKYSLLELFTKRKIIIVSLNKGLIGAESCALLGSLIVSSVWTLALSRSSLPQNQRPIVNIFLDELSDYLRLPGDLSSSLAVSRSLGLSLHLIFQYRHQIKNKELLEGIDANVHNKIIFGLNAGDAKTYASFAPELEPIDFMRLPRYGVYAQLLRDGKTAWISGKTFQPPPPIRDPLEIRTFSEKKYGTPIAESEKEFAQLYRQKNLVEEEHPKRTNEPIGRRKRRSEK